MNECVDPSLKRQGRICCAESAFKSAKEHAIVYKPNSKEIEPYNAATNNCQHFAARMSEILLKSFAHTRRMLRETNGRMFARAGAAVKDGLAKAGAAAKSGLAKAGAAAKKGAHAVVGAIKRLFDIGATAKKNGWTPVRLTKGGQVAAGGKGGHAAAAGKGRRPGK
ncbi:hypothetical protein DYB32_008778 [Aphanomyces invadans]|nr:hypothetical protein DYB32_008778 [Aphanomyces invadans]